jgi:hypothetical protein
MDARKSERLGGKAVKGKPFGMEYGFVPQRERVTRSINLKSVREEPHKRGVL